ncbi:PIN domain-containing protein [Sphingomonas phyllosphaerae]|uniref:PIN domain-containing protein n=1 Tax=Sphingomonas phyllosphaerae TaxID=257003 RepID=UPI0012DBD692|nr:PIN domain-containing protein [Sphingomonas phyllosphaerae]
MALLNVFIDTNVLVRFFAFTNDNLDEAAKLSALIETKQIRVFVTEQVMDEFYRQRDRELLGSIRAFETGIINEQTPRFMDGYEELKAYKEAARSIKDARKKLLLKVREDLANQTLRADTVTNDIFDKSGILFRDQEVLTAARLRKELGNPPGKEAQRSIGDQINWEMLLKHVPNGEDIHVISRDGDFGDGEKVAQRSSFLQQEWHRKKGGEMTLYAGLAEFTKEHFPDIKLPSDAKRLAAVKALANSGSFSQTHDQIALLNSVYDGITSDDAVILLRAFVDNGQIGMIYDDHDVKDFFRRLHSDFCLYSSPDLDSELRAHQGSGIFPLL